MAVKQVPICEHKFNNWIKAELAIRFTKEGIQPFVEDKIQDFQVKCLSEIRQRNNLAEGTTCMGCSIKDLRSKNYRCQNKICSDFIVKIHLAHQYQQGDHYKGPSWKNTDASKWCTNSWEVAKCYMPREGYQDALIATDTDFNGIINVILNHMGLKSKFNCPENLEKGKEVCKTLRHSPSLEIEDEDLQKHFDDFENILTDQGYLASCVYAKNALDKLSKLRRNTAVIEKDYVLKILGDKQMTETNEQNKQLLKDTDRVLKILKLQALKEDLITFYKEKHSSISVSPLVSEDDVPIVEFYVQQRMNQVDFSWRGKISVHRSNVDTYEEIFKNGSVLCRNIYLMGQAGSGKTTFAKRLCNVWCFTKGGGGKEPQNLSESAKVTLDRFDFLFLVLLRDVQGNECDIDEMIQSQTISYLSRANDYRDEFLQDVLHQQTCLVIVDGLDEWSHPQAVKCQNIKPIPHHKSRPNCTILSTTRPWKMFESGICNSMIDKCIELKEFDESSSDMLISNVMGTLTDTKANERKETKDLMIQIKKHNLHWLISTPVILIQMICLWHDNKSLGDSKCQVYSNIIDFLLERAEEKGSIRIKSVDQSPDEKKSELLNCLRGNEHCKLYHSLLTAVGKLAFRALCSETRELSLVFETSLIKQILSDEQIHNCLQTGILTENRTNRVSARPINYSFLHKTFQEYFCAFYISTVGFDICIREVLKQCQSIEAILELSGVFVFLSGLCPEVLSSISVKLGEIISRASISQDFRHKVCTSVDWNVCYRRLKEIQDMNIDCLKESKAENAGKVNIVQEDFVIDGDCHNESYCEHLKKLVGMNKNNIRSVKIYSEPGTTLSSHIHDFTLTGQKHLDKVEIIVDKIINEDLDLLLSGSVNCLKSLCICKDIGSQVDPPCDPLSEGNVRTIQQMPNLVSIMLECLSLDHELLNDLFCSFEKRTEMTEIYLGYIKCSDHDRNCTGFHLDLSKHSNLSKLEIGFLPLSDVHINTQPLKECRVGRFDSQNVLRSVLCCLEEVPDLQSLMCFGFDRPDEVEAVLNTLPKLAKLRVLIMKRVNLENHAMDVQSNLDHIKMCNVHIGRPAFESIVKKVEEHRHSTICEFMSCEITSTQDEYNKIRRYMDDSKRFVMLCDQREGNKTLKVNETKQIKHTLIFRTK